MNNNTPFDIEQINERDREEPELTTPSLYDAHGESISDEVWARRLEYEQYMSEWNGDEPDVREFATFEQWQAGEC